MNALLDKDTRIALEYNFLYLKDSVALIFLFPHFQLNNVALMLGLDKQFLIKFQKV